MEKTKPVGRPRLNGKPHVTRQDIFMSTAALIARHGYAGTSLRMIANSVDASTASIFNLFGSKDGLLNSLIEFMANTSFAFYEQVKVLKLDPAVALYKCVYEEAFAVAHADAAFPSLFYLPELAKPEFVKAQSVRAEMVANYRDLIKTGINQKLFIDVPRQFTAEQIFQLTETSILTNKNTNHLRAKTSAKSQARAAADLALRGILLNPKSLPEIRLKAAKIKLSFATALTDSDSNQA